MTTDAARAKPYWVVYRFAYLFVASYETREEAEAHAARLNQKVPASPGRTPYYLVIRNPDYTGQKTP